MRNIFFTHTAQCLDIDHVIAVERRGDGTESQVLFHLSSGATVTSPHESSATADGEIKDAGYFMQHPAYEDVFDNEPRENEFAGNKT